MATDTSWGRDPAATDQTPWPSLDGCLAPIAPFIRVAEFAVRSPWRIPNRRLMDYLLIFVQDGQCVAWVEGVEHRFSQGEFCLIQPRDLHALEGTTDTITPFAHLDIFFNPQREHAYPSLPGQVDLSAVAHLVQPRLNDVDGFHVPVKFRPHQPEWFRETLLSAVSLWQHRDLFSRMEADLLAHELVLALFKQYLHPSHTAAAPPHSLDWMPAYLSLHLADPISVADMARQAHLSTSRFSALFRRRFGMSPHRYLLHVRTAHAQELLRQTDLSLQLISEYCGFGSVHHFAATFKRLTGHTPGTQRHKGEQ